jgi:hypothetical protein
MRRLLALLAILAFPMPEAVAVPLTTQVPLTLQLSPCSAHAPIAGNGSGVAQVCDTLTAMLDSAFSSTQGSLLYRNSTVWTALGPGTNGFFLETQGAGANLIWAAAAGGAGCTIAGGAQFQIVVNNGSSGCSSSPDATVNVGALALGVAGTVGTVQLFNATSGSVLLNTVTGALGSVTASLPANTGTIAELNLVQTWSALQTFNNSDIKMVGSSTGATTLTSANAGASNFTLTIPANTGTLAELNLAQTFTAAQTFTNSDILLLGSSTGATTLTSANAGASNFTLTLPAATDTVAVLGTAQTFTAAQTFTNSDLELLGSSTGDTIFTSANASATNYTLTIPANTGTLAELNLVGTWTAAQTFTNSDILLLGSSTGATTFTSANAGASNFTITVPAVTDTLATLGTGSQQLSGGVLITDGNNGTKSSGTYTVVCGNVPQQYITNGGAFTLAAPASSSNCLLQVTNNGSAGTISFSGFSTGSNTGASLDSVNGHVFTISIWKINGTAGYSVYAHQ